MKQYAVIHVQKCTGAGSALGRHIDRAHTPDNADKSLNNKNMYCYVQDGKMHSRPLTGAERAPLQQRVDERIEQGYTGKTAIRKDAVKQLNVILTGSHERMLEIFADKQLRTEWIVSNYRFLDREYGLSNIVGFVVHMDEETPHIHATVVPLTSDGRLSAKEVVGDQKKLQGLQDRYGNAMKRYNLERGEVNSKAHHIDTQEYYRHINAAVKAAEMEIKDVTMPVVELPPALIGREAYQKQLQTQLFDYWLKISKISKQKELKVLSSEQKAKRLELAKKVEKSPLLASRLNSQPVIRQQPQQGEQRRNRGMHM